MTAKFKFFDCFAAAKVLTLYHLEIENENGLKSTAFGFNITGSLLHSGSEKIHGII